MTARGTVPSDARNPFIGSCVALAFGLVFVLANSGELPTAASVTIRVVAVVAAVALLLGAVRRLRRAGTRTQPGPPMSFGRRYQVIVALEVLALVAGLVVINGILGAGRFGVAWVAVVVGVHFLALATIWWPRGFAVLGAVIALLGVAGFLVGFLGGSAAAIGLVAGVMSGAALFAMVAVALTRP